MSLETSSLIAIWGIVITALASIGLGLWSVRGGAMTGFMHDLVESNRDLRNENRALRLECEATRDRNESLEQIIRECCGPEFLPAQ